jgi:hypothetical protein
MKLLVGFSLPQKKKRISIKVIPGRLTSSSTLIFLLFSKKKIYGWIGSPTKVMRFVRD